jgi:hypothetical protein
MALDFTTASLDSRVTFTRTGNTATVTNSSGYVVPINADLPRFDYNPTTLVCNGLLIEESRTNIFTYSADFSNAAGRPWQWIDVTTTQSATTSPDNTNSGNKILETATTAIHRLRWTSFTAVANSPFSYSVYLKAAERSAVRLLLTGVTGTSRVDFDLNTGAITNIVGDLIWSTPTATCVAVGNGWFRCTMTSTPNLSGAGCSADILLSNAGSFNYLGDPTKGVFGWGAQLEIGAFPTSYIPTVASQVTRTADVAVMTGVNFSSWYNASQGAIYAEATQTIDSASACVIAEMNDNTINERILIAINSPSGSGSRRSQFGLFGSGATQAQIFNTSTFGTTGKNVSMYVVNNFATAQNAETVLTDLSGVIPVVDRMYIGCRVSNASCLNGWVRKISFWKQRILNAEGQAFSK